MQDSNNNIDQKSETSSLPNSTPKKQVSNLKVKGTEQISIMKEANGIVRQIKFFMVSENIDGVVEVQSTATIKVALTIFLKNFESNLKLDMDPNNYQIFMAKKNGQPKDDYGAFLPDQQIGKTGTLAYSIIYNTAMKYQNQTIESEQTNVKKNQESPMRPDKQTILLNTYSNPLSEMEGLRERKKALSKEIEPVTQKHIRKFWFIDILGCGGCSNE